MAWTIQSDWISQAVKSSGAAMTISVNAGGGLTISSIGIVRIAADNLATVAGETNDIIGVTDSAGNVYQKLYEYTQANGAAGDGATLGLFITQATGNLSTGGSTVTVSFSAAVTSKVVLASNLLIGNGNIITIASRIDAKVGGAAAASQRIAGLPSGEYFFDHFMALEWSNATFSLTPTSSYLNGWNGTAGGADTDNIEAVEEFRILTGTGDTVNWTVNSGDHAQVFMALKEAAPSFTVAGNYGGVHVTLSAATITWTGQSAVTASNGFIVAFVGCDNMSTAELSTNFVTAVTIGGQAARKIGEWTNANAATGAGATVAAFYLKPTSNLATSALGIATFSPQATRGTVNSFRGNSPGNLSLGVQTIIANSYDNTSIGAHTITAMPYREYMFVGGFAGEESTAAAFTEASNYTTAGTRQGGGGTSTSAISVHTAYRVLAGTGDTYDPATIPADYASLYFAIYAAATKGAGTQADAIIQKTQTLIASSDAILKKTLQIAASLDSKIAAGTTKAASLNAIIQHQMTLAASLNAVLQGQISKGASLDAAIQHQMTLLASLSAVLQETMSLATSADAKMARFVALSATIDAVFAVTGSVMTLIASLDARLTGSWVGGTPVTGSWVSAVPV